ncbi:GAF domain-containing protein [Hymenobacter canadensis]|uniref:GAF domain-containing protein n=1 Tax=Hymenobacter canadensis TaxID=2999067 RepID=A0ABY7LQN3_9BACT|nr:GAF domain-containing protein [Hymenobacter canadensis]WBA42738.1 GAF domain-containing protein [Hymenobacter canadensis]
MDTLPDELIPANDAHRLRTLHQYRILNTTPEPVFDEYVALAAQLFNLPISLISLVNEQEVFFKANTGMPGLERVDRPDSLCSAAVLQDKVLSFEDLSANSCQLINPYMAQSAGLRFYAGAALRMPNGDNIGSLCVIGREPRAITAGEEALLMDLADLASRTIQLRQLMLDSGQLREWQQVQAELQELLHDNSALARYLTSRTGTVSANEVDLRGVQQRLQVLHRSLDRHMAEVARLSPSANQENQ